MLTGVTLDTATIITGFGMLLTAAGVLWAGKRLYSLFSK